MTRIEHPEFGWGTVVWQDGFGAFEELSRRPELRDVVYVVLELDVDGRLVPMRLNGRAGGELRTEEATSTARPAARHRPAGPNFNRDGREPLA